MKSFAILYFTILSLTCFGQKDFFHAVVIPDTSISLVSDEASQYAKLIQSENLKEIIYYLASDSCEGRELGTKGNDRAGDYIGGLFEKYAIPKLKNQNSYFQQVGFTWVNWDKLSFKINGVNYKQLWDYLTIPNQNEDLELKTDEVLFMGYGIDDAKYSDYKDIDVKGKVILIYKGEPKNKAGNFYITGTTIPSTWSSDFNLKIDAAARHGAKLILVIEDKFKEFVDANRQSVISPVINFKNSTSSSAYKTNSLYLSSTTASILMSESISKVLKARDKINKSGKAHNLLIKSNLEISQKRNIKSIDGRNILAYFEGTDKKDELIIVSAHYDHIGKRGTEVYNGADDNASGSSAVIEIAHTLQQLKKSGKSPRRSILCMLVTGEEKGLLGSMYYVNNPVFPLKNTIADINVDMIGRTDDKYKSDSNYIYVIGSDRISGDLHQINLSVNQKYSQLKLDHTFNSEADPNRFYYRSDHYNFAEKGIPAIFFFSGVHEDYHRVTDDPEKIMFGKAEKIARHIFLLTWELANREQKINHTP
jgi:hypothetical protein